MALIKAVVFDLGGTLIDYIGRYASWPDLETPGFTAAYDYLQLQGLTLPGPDRFRMVGFDLLPGRWRQATSGQKNLTLPSLLAEVLANFNIPASDPASLEEAAERYQSAVCADAKPIPDGHEVLGLLQAQGFRLGLISNTMFTGQAHIADMEKFGLASFFDAMVFSADENKWKPNVAPFSHILAQLGVDPGMAIFIGDDPASDLVGGRRAGMYTVYFRSNDRFAALDGLLPDATIHSLQELPPLISRLNG
jgi:putative hydrolase of the HAD superfamily